MLPSIDTMSSLEKCTLRVIPFHGAKGLMLHYSSTKMENTFLRTC